MSISDQNRLRRVTRSGLVLEGGAEDVNVHLSVCRYGEDGAVVALFHVIGGAEDRQDSSTGSNAKAVTWRLMTPDDEV